MKLFLCVLACFALPAHAAFLTVNQPHRADTYTGSFFAFSTEEAQAGFTVVHDDAHTPPIPDRILSSDFDSTWAIWRIDLCDGVSCGTIEHVCTLSHLTIRGAMLDCLDIDC